MTARALQAGKVLADQANALQKGVPGLIFGNYCMVGLCAWLFAEGASRSVLLAWLVAQVAFSTLSLVQALRIRHRPALPRNAARRLKANTIGITMAGLMWLWGILQFWPIGQVAAQSLFALLIIGQIGGALHALNAWLPAFYGFFLPLLLAVLAATVREATPISLAFAGAAAVFGMTTARFAALMHGTLLHSFRARYEVEDLATDLKVEKERAEEANLAKSRFLAAASHDLRQPVHALTLLIDALAAQPPGPEADRMLARISATVGSMGQMFDALLDVSKLDAGVVSVAPRVFDLKAMVEQLCAQEAPVAAARGLALRVNTRPVPVATDPLLLSRIVRNLLANALRYTDRGGVLVSVRQRGRQAVLRVVDTGIGIPAERQAEVFEEFVQLHNPERDRNNGLGLGLAIVRRLTRLLEATLTLRSNPGRGSAFTLHLPVAHAVPGEVEAAPSGARGDVVPAAHGEAMPSAGALLLVIDDDADVRTGMRTLLASWGYRVIDSAGIADMLPQLRSVPRVPALILSDYRLRGEETGTQVIERLRFEYNEDIPAILITGDTAPERLVEAHASGHLLLHKPLAARVLREQVSRLLAEAAGRCDLPD